eukprot:TRINITY_DN3970_c0_g3_i2.p1 TRINITY_DN3970_c0_g3~~TRINITY_DN3970_c0_g3_i2.p1  ORF type:complete len:1320 (-),score=296.29 TRINITY_DN3970_c0_g3_i2:1747-5706(-)
MGCGFSNSKKVAPIPPQTSKPSTQPTSVAATSSVDQKQPSATQSSATQSSATQPPIAQPSSIQTSVTQPPEEPKSLPLTNVDQKPATEIVEASPSITPPIIDREKINKMLSDDIHDGGDDDEEPHDLKQDDRPTSPTKSEYPDPAPLDLGKQLQAEGNGLATRPGYENQSHRRSSLSSRRRSSTADKVLTSIKRLEHANGFNIPHEFFDMDADEILATLRRFSLSKPLISFQTPAPRNEVLEPAVKLFILIPPAVDEKEQQEFISLFNQLQEYAIERRILLECIDPHIYTHSPPHLLDYNVYDSIYHIRRTDYFLFIMGDSYGWVPEPDDPRYVSQELLQQYEVCDCQPGASIMDLEIKLSFDKTESIKKSFYYFINFESDKSHPEYTQISTLIGFVLESRPPSGIEIQHHSSSTELIANFFNSLTTRFERDFPKNIVPKSIRQHITDFHQQRAITISKTCYGRQNLLQFITTKLEQEETAKILIYGPPGVGKTTLLSKLYTDIPKGQACIRFCDFGKSARGLEGILIAILEALSITVPEGYLDVAKSFGDIIKSKHRSINTFVAIIDSIDHIQLPETVQSFLDWIPDNLPSNFKFVMSCSYGPDVATRLKDPSVFVMDCYPFPRGELESLITEEILHLSETPEAEDVHRVAICPFYSNPINIFALFTRLKSIQDPTSIRALFSQAPQLSLRELIIGFLDDAKAKFDNHEYPNHVAKVVGLLSIFPIGLRINEIQSMVRIPYAPWKAIQTHFSDYIICADTRYSISHSSIARIFLNWVNTLPHGAAISNQELTDTIGTYYERLLPHVNYTTLLQLADMYMLQGLWSRLKDLVMHKDTQSKFLSPEFLEYMPNLWKTLQAHGYNPNKCYSEYLSEYWNFRDALQVAKVLKKVGFRPEAIEVVRKIMLDDSVKESDEYVTASLEYARINFEEGVYQEALDAYQASLDVMEDSNISGKSELMASTLDEYAFLLDQVGQHQAAYEKLQKALVMRMEEFGINSIPVSLSYNNLGLHFTLVNSFKEARNYYKRGFDIMQLNPSTDQLDIALIKSNMSGLLLKEGKLDEAFDEYLAAYETILKLRGPQHQEVAAILDNLGIITRQQSKPKESLEYHERAISIYQHIYGPSHTSQSSVLNNMALALKDLGRFTEAEEKALQALSIDQAQFGEDHENIAASMFTLGMLYSSQGQIEKSYKYFKNSAEIRRKILGESNILYVNSLKSTASLANEMKMADESLKLYLQIAKIQTRHFPNDELGLALTNYNLGILYFDMEDDNLALKYFMQAYDVQKKALGDDSELVKNTLSYINDIQRGPDIESAEVETG